MKKAVDERIRSLMQPSWHYESRLKELVSFAVKLESGRVDDPRALEDFFACVLVVENQGKVSAARKFVEAQFDVRYSRPRGTGRTHKRPSDFPFDDLRLYATWRNDEVRPAVPFAGVIFEIQVKTFLQHAWGIATRDLVYKADRVSWPLQRVAYQVKAMLEHAEVSIARAEVLAETEAIRLDTADYEALEEILAFLERHWPPESLPSDRVRLGQNVAGLLGCLGVGLAEVEDILEIENGAGRGARTLNLSPYGILIQVLVNQRPNLFTRKGSGNFKVFAPREIEGLEGLANSIQVPLVRT